MPMVLNAERCSIFIHDDENITTWLKVGIGLQECDIEVTGEFKSVVGKIISSGKAEIIPGPDKQNGIHKQLADITEFMTRDI
jgi:hypothetical protein